MIGVLWFDSDPETTKTILRNCLWIGIVETPSAEQPLAALINGPEGPDEEGGPNLAANKN